MYNFSDHKGQLVKVELIQSNPSRVSQKNFYIFRDAVYKLIKENGKDFTKIDGTPFRKFDHDQIKDSPLKNYRNELIAFKETFKQYFPELYSQVMNMSFEGAKEESNSRPLELDVEETLKGVASEYIDTLIAKRNSGMVLSKAEQNILTAYEKLQDELREGAKKQVTADIGKFVTENWLMIVLALLILVMLIVKKK